MANEITAHASLTVANGLIKGAYDPGTKSFNMTGTNVRLGTQAFTTTASLIDVLPLAGANIQGILMLYNLDTTNNLLIARTSAFTANTDVAVVLPGQPMLLPINASVTNYVLYAKSSAGTVSVEYFINQQ